MRMHWTARVCVIFITIVIHNSAKDITVIQKQGAKSGCEPVWDDIL